MMFEGLHNQKIYAGEYQPQVTLAKNWKNHKPTTLMFYIRLYM